MILYRSNPVFGQRIQTLGTKYVMGGDIWQCTKVPDDYLSRVTDQTIYYDSFPSDEPGRVNFELFSNVLLNGKQFNKSFRMPDQYSDEHLCISDGDLYSCRVIPMRPNDHIKQQEISIIFQTGNIVFNVKSAIVCTIGEFIENEEYNIESNYTIKVIKCYIDGKEDKQYINYTLDQLRESLINKIGDKG